MTTRTSGWARFEWDEMVLTGVLLVIIAILLVVIWSIRRHRDPRLAIECGSPIDQVMPSLAGLTLSTVLPGNAIEVHENGAFFDALLREIEGARQTVHFETFLWKEGVLGTRLANALADRARAGLQVRVLVDATGSADMGRGALETMKAAGCRIAKFHERKLQNIGVLGDRDHRKLAVIDGRIAFVGGHCIVDEWLGNAEDGVHYADISVSVQGPVVNCIQAAFSENWAGETGELFVGDDVFPDNGPIGDIAGFVSYAKPESSAPAVKILHHTAICLARSRIWIQNPYFIPEPEAIAAFGQAVKRGVDVRVLMPATSGSDNPMVQHAGHANFDQLLTRGVRLFEYPHTLLHQKVMTIDGVWCTVGSSNFDDRSFEINDEIMLTFVAPGIARKLDSVFERYAARANEIDLAAWRRRGLVHRIKDRLAYSINEVL